MDGKVTTETILNWFEEAVTNKYPIEPHLWLDAAQKLNVLLGDECDELYKLEQLVAKMKVELLQGGFTSAKAKTFIEAEDIHRDMRKQAAKIKHVEEMIRLAKIRSRIASEEIKGY